QPVNVLLISHSTDIVNNAAEYTEVDKADNDTKKAYEVNEKGTANLATVCKYINAKLINVSPAFVFDGTSTMPYTASNATKPLRV
ncbi:sugar nucleotide-binding protein, partial [Pseudoalteromonas sp. S1691]|uniref:sugar nucleotide-binding protein n=1 Tax=Pseudoalteromonas sp. S1691 TaxID=579513 RepID=UPI00110CF9A3